MKRTIFNLKCLLGSAVLLLAAGILVALAIVYSGVFDAGADRPPYPLEHWLFSTTRRHSIETRANGVDPPQDLNAPERINRGALLYEEMCAHCHLRPGMEPTELNRGLNPEAPLLAEWSDTPAYTFLAIKRGIRSTGMPAWGLTHEDEVIWDMVAFQRQLSNLSAAEYEAMVREAKQDDAPHSGHEH